MGAECSKCGHDVIDACEFCALRSEVERLRSDTTTRDCSECLRLTEDLERQRVLTGQWATQAERLRAERDTVRRLQGRA